MDDLTMRVNIILSEFVLSMLDDFQKVSGSPLVLEPGMPDGNYATTNEKHDMYKQWKHWKYIELIEENDLPGFAKAKKDLITILEHPNTENRWDRLKGKSLCSKGVFKTV